MLSLISSVLVTLVTAGILIDASSHTLRAMWTSRFNEATMNKIVFHTGANLEDFATNLNGKNLRILALGDSITNGWRSSDGNGYRLDLFNRLSSSNTVDFIGSIQAGTMHNNQCEGHNGAVISQIASYANASLPERPNVVLLMAGTNDMNIPTDPDTAPDRLGNLIDQIITACPDAAVLVAQIIHSGYVVTNDRINLYNSALEGVVAQRAKRGKHVLLAEAMSDALSLTTDYADDLHPNDRGYEKIAETWYEYLNIASHKGWINEPVTIFGNGTVSNSTNATTTIQTTSSVPATFATGTSMPIAATNTESVISMPLAIFTSSTSAFVPPTTLTSATLAFTPSASIARSATARSTASSSGTLPSIVSIPNAALKTQKPILGIGLAGLLMSVFF